PVAEALDAAVAQLHPRVENRQQLLDVWQARRHQSPQRDDRALELALVDGDAREHLRLGAGRKTRVKRLFARFAPGVDARTADAVAFCQPAYRSVLPLLAESFCGKLSTLGCLES